MISNVPLFTPPLVAAEVRLLAEILRTPVVTDTVTATGELNTVPLPTFKVPVIVAATVVVAAIVIFTILLEVPVAVVLFNVKLDPFAIDKLLPIPAAPTVSVVFVPCNVTIAEPEMANEFIAKEGTPVTVYVPAVVNVTLSPATGATPVDQLPGVLQLPPAVFIQFGLAAKQLFVITPKIIIRQRECSVFFI